MKCLYSTKYARVLLLGDLNVNIVEENMKTVSEAYVLKSSLTL